MRSFFVLGAVLLGALFLQAGCERHSSERSSPVLVWREEGAKCRPSPADLSLAWPLLLSSFSEEFLRTTTAEASRVADALEARAHPLGIDLEEINPRETLKTWAPRVLPSWDAALALSAPSSCSADGEAQVRLARSCEGILAGERCAPLWGKTSFPRRIAFLAWPFTHAIVLRIPASEQRTRISTALRARVGDTSTLALVLSAEHPCSPELAEELGQELSRIRRFQTHLGPEEQRIPHRIPTSQVALPSAFGLDPTLLVLVPRKSTMAEPERFSREVTELLGLAGGHKGVEWIHSGAPQPSHP